MSFLLFLFACHSVTETGPSGMAGRLVDATGDAVPGVVVSTVEAESRTNAEGHFAVPWKKPDHYVFFNHDGLFFRRTLQEGESGVLEIPLPATRSVQLHCPAEACPLTLTWNPEPGFEVRRTHRCVGPAQVDLGAVPVGPPRASCDGAAFTVRDDGSTMTVGPAKKP